MISPVFSTSAAAAAACGGLMLGCTVAVKAGLMGQVLGCSGATKGLIAGPRAEKGAFVAGLIAAGAVMSQVYGGFEAMPPTEGSQRHGAFLLRLGVGGLLVGFGTAMGNGTPHPPAQRRLAQCLCADATWGWCAVWVFCRPPHSAARRCRHRTWLRWSRTASALRMRSSGPPSTVGVRFPACFGFFADKGPRECCAINAGPAQSGRRAACHEAGAACGGWQVRKVASLCEGPALIIRVYMRTCTCVCVC